MRGKNSPSNNVYTRSSIWRMFREAADQDYIVARVSARMDLLHQFAWSSQQCLEKIMKAVLLLNDQSVNEFQHDVEGIFKPVSEIGGDLLPYLLCPPNGFQSQQNTFRSQFEPTISYIKRVNNYGNTHNRYRAYSVSIPLYDLNHLDQVYFLLRRIAFPLDLELKGFEETASVLSLTHVTDFP